MDFLKQIKKAILNDEKKVEINHSQDRITSQVIVDKFLSDPQFPYLVSFSRTGSHWLRMLLELYLQKPSLKLLFFQRVEETSDYSCFHTHDLDLKVQASRVIYLYRDPVETIFSQMSFHGQDLNNKEIIESWTDLYARHVHKWLVEESFTTEKVVLSYEGMKKDLESEFEKISGFFKVPFDRERVKLISGQVSKEQIKEKTKHDPRVINSSKNYSVERDNFTRLQGQEIYLKTFQLFPDLQLYFKK